MSLEPAEWRLYEPIDGGTTLRITADLGALEPRRIDVDAAPEAVTVTVYEYLPPGTHAIPAIGIRATFEVRLPTPLGDRRVVDGASGEPRQAWHDPAGAPGVRVPVGEEFRWADVAGSPWWGQTA